MIRLFQFLLFGCWHHWTLHSEDKVINKAGDWIYTDYVLRCERCGDMTSRSL